MVVSVSSSLFCNARTPVKVQTLCNAYECYAMLQGLTAPAPVVIYILFLLNKRINKFNLVVFNISVPLPLHYAIVDLGRKGLVYTLRVWGSDL